MTKKKILLATGNPGKAGEIVAILGKSSSIQHVDFLLPGDFHIDESPLETGSNYEANAVIKARFYAGKAGVVTLADDSGLEVYALDGFPGIKSARVKAPQNTDKSRYEILLDMLEGVELEKRGAKFVCVAAAYLPQSDEIIVSRGEWEGMILTNPCGGAGFGYDPIFFDPVYQKSAAEMSTEEKNNASHRGKAFRNLWEKITPRL